jgi:hypothetical protein
LREVLPEYVTFLSNTAIRHGTEAIGIMWSPIRYFKGLDKEVYLVVAVDGKVGILRDTNVITHSLYCLRHTYATLRLGSGTNIHQLAAQMRTSVKKLETFYSEAYPKMNAATHKY